MAALDPIQLQLQNDYAMREINAAFTAAENNAANWLPTQANVAQVMEDLNHAHDFFGSLDDTVFAIVFLRDYAAQWVGVDWANTLYTHLRAILERGYTKRVRPGVLRRMTPLIQEMFVTTTDLAFQQGLAWQADYGRDWIVGREMFNVLGHNRMAATQGTRMLS